MNPRLLSQKETAEMLGVSLSSFKKQEKAGDIQIPRRMVGTSVRYLNLKVLEYILADDEEGK
jgi:predicted DNA-binding transcriptional regulator AlpA